MPDPFLADSSLVHHVELDKPGTHVIAIGIGQYDHLEGGGRQKSKYHLDLQQLRSPPQSARAVASWFIEKFDCPDLPLASVSLVLSENAPSTFRNTKTGKEYGNIPDGTMQSVREALKQWVARAEMDPQSHIVLYFCGHGLSAGVQNYYLVRDYGSDDSDPLLGAINFKNFLTGLSCKKPTYQFLLFDACRSQNSVINLNRDGGQSIFVADPEGRLGIAETVQQCPIFSTELDRSALGLPDQPSLCAQAFIRVMNGACCRKEGNEWYVTTHRVVEALSDFQSREALRGDKTQSADAGSYAKFRLRRLRATPQIPVFVRLDDPRLTSRVKVTAKGVDTPPRCISDPNSQGWVDRQEWETELEIGQYDFTAERLAPAAAVVIKKDVVMPTHIEVTLEVGHWQD
jgi:Caspase domain